MDLLTSISAVITAGAASIAVFVANKALKEWKNELTSRVLFEEGLQIIKDNASLCGDFVRAISCVPDNLKEENNFPTKEGLKPLLDVFELFENHVFYTNVLWGESATLGVSDLLEEIKVLQGSLEVYFFKQEHGGKMCEQSEADKLEMKNQVLAFCASHDRERKINDTLVEIREKCLPSIERFTKSAKD